MPARFVAVVLTTLAMSGALAPWRPEAASAEPMRAMIPTPLVLEVGDIDSPALPTAVALRLMRTARTGFQEHTGWECLQPVWEPEPRPGEPILKIRTRLFADDVTNDYVAVVELDAQLPGRQVLSASERNSFSLVPEELGANPLEDLPLEGELFDPSVVALVASGFDVPVRNAIDDLDTQGVKPCAFKLKLHGRMLVKGTSGGIATSTSTRNWDGEGSTWMVANGDIRMSVDATAQTTYESSSASGGVAVVCTGSGSGQERVRIEGSFDNTNAALKFTDIDGASDDIRQSGTCVNHVPAMVLVPGVSSVPERNFNEPLEPQGLHGLSSPGDFLRGSPVSLAYREGLRVFVPKPARVQADEWEFTIELVNAGHF